ncbi:hypothetical protein ABBQ38_005548 [Trebouxia sp. C0009 RCD-2024]
MSHRSILTTLCRQARATVEVSNAQTSARSARVLHTTPWAGKEDLGDREQEDMPAAGIATSGPGTGSSNIGDAGQREAKDGKLSGEKSKEDVKTKPFFDVDEGGKGTQVGPSGDNETFKSMGRDTKPKGDTMGIGDKKGDDMRPGPGTK